MTGRFLAVLGLFLFQTIDVSIGEPVGICASEDVGNVVFLTDSADCSIFYKCDSGTPVAFQCPSGLLFNSQIDNCVFPEDSNCVVGVPEEVPEENEEVPEENEEVPEENEEVPEENEEVPEENEEVPEENEEVPEEEGGESAPVGECPEEDGEFATHLPHATDCTKFYKCDRGTPVVQECPLDLLFNPELLVCDFPESAGCGAGGVPNPNVEEPEDDNEADPDDNGNNVEDVPAPVGECPEVDGEFVTLLPHGTDCTKFYICNEGTPVVTVCPGNLEFNPEVLVCDYPESAGCVAGAPEEVPEESEEVPEENEEVPEESEEVPEENEEVPEEEGGESVPVGECPEVDGEFVTLLPHATDCTKFYICNEGIPVVTACSSNLEFNPELLVCDYPENAGCVAGSNGGVPSPNVEEPNEDNESVPDDNGNNVEDVPAPVGECPEVDGEFVTLLPHGTDCTKFYTCNEGTPVVTVCPANLEFNPEVLVCDYPESAGCVAGVPEEVPEENEEVPEEVPEENEDLPEENEEVPEENEEDESAPVGECPAEDGEFVTLLPSATDCTKFYICNEGTPVLTDCPSNLEFNPELLVCDYPESAGCVA